MAIEVEELVDSREIERGPSLREDRRYLVFGTEDQLAASSAVLLVAPSLVVNPSAQNQYMGIGGVSARLKSGAWDIWEATVRYTPRGRQQGQAPGALPIQFSAQGQMVSISRSLECLRSYKANGEADPGKSPVFAAGKTVDVPVATSCWTEPHLLSDAYFGNPDYRRRLHQLVGSVNKYAFRGYSPGEVRFEGVTATLGADNVWDAKFTFQYKANKTGLSVPDGIGGFINGVEKRGWEVEEALTIEDTQIIDNNGTPKKTMVDRVTGVKIHRVHFEEDFAELAVGA